MTTTIVPMIETRNNELIVNSETIAEGAGFEHRVVLQKISNNIEDLEEFGQVSYSVRSGYNNAQVRVALLSEAQSTLLMTFFRNNHKVKPFKVALVKAFYEMRDQIQRQAFDPASLTRADILKLATEADNEARELRGVIELNAPKVAYVDNHVNPEDVLLFRTVARNLNVNESDLRKALIYRRWIYVSGIRKSKSVIAKRYSAYQTHQAYFKHCVTHEVATVNGTPWHTLKVTPAGAASLSRFADRLTKEYGSVRKSLQHLEAAYNQRKGIAA